MQLKHIPDVMKHVLKIQEASDFLMDYVHLDSYILQCLLTHDLIETTQQSYVSWDFDDNSTDKFIIIRCINPYPLGRMKNNSTIERFEINRNGKIEVQNRDGTSYTISDMRLDAWNEEGIFQLQTLHNIGDIDVNVMRDIWFTYLDFHNTLWGKYVHDQDYLRNR